MTDLQKIQLKNKATFDKKFLELNKKMESEQDKMNLLTLYECYYLLLNQLNLTK